ncbi:unnamed protein product [Clonostachys solani]|uniref:Uncharacterized protein n=1 Tax=Clonostachys solani TaxID=160281 RepID=A0A9N9YYZ9_9HYPO|nr:unnamed protein product [Clonostachys solani]
MAAATIQPYELYSDAPGFLLNKPEWEEADAAHPETFDFGKQPQGWPVKFTGPDVWTGDHLEKHPDLYIKTLTQGEIGEIDSAIKAWRQLKIPVSSIDRSNFRLPTVGPILRQLSDNIYNGVGVQILRGFPIQRYDKEEQVIAFLGINSWIGDRRLNQGAGRGVCHIKGEIGEIDSAIKD